MLGNNEIRPKRISYVMRSIAEASRIFIDKVGYHIGNGDRVKIRDQSWHKIGRNILK